MAGRNAEYWETLERLLDSKMQADYEDTLQDDFADHGKDIKNFVSSNTTKIHNTRVVLFEVINTNIINNWYANKKPTVN